MASGSQGDPPRAQGRQDSARHRRAQELNSETQVVEETEEVFRSYAFHRYRREREEGEEVPLDPEIEEFQQEEVYSTGSQVGRRLAIIGDDINERYDEEFRCMLKSLQPTKDNAYEYFTRIASSLGRVARREQPVREWHQLGPRGGAAGLRVPHGAARVPAGHPRLPAPHRQIRGRVHAAQPHRPLDRPAGRMGGCPQAGQCLCELHAGGGGPGAAGAPGGTTLPPALTEGWAEAGGGWLSSQSSALH
ncbi:bcl-2 homologous antagonist/killer isoform X1 [Melanerpes formicivorus]|uniref:bcl-2 homologous antagonist/killer isoform X1 n=1 Tax=Melanerpes formicivorus TaxID=211600 RepID=UPI0035902857